MSPTATLEQAPMPSAQAETEVMAPAAHQITGEQASLAVQELDKVLTTGNPAELQAAQAVITQAEQAPDQTAEQAKVSRWKKLGRIMLGLGVIEGIGILVDAGLFGLGQAGVAPLRELAIRESLAGTVDVAAINKVMPHEKHEQAEAHQNRLRKVGRKAGNLALGVTVAVTAAKFGQGVAEHISSTFSHGFGELGVQLGSKMAGVVGFNTLRRRMR